MTETKTIRFLSIIGCLLAGMLLREGIRVLDAEDVPEAESGGTDS